MTSGKTEDPKPLWPPGKLVLLTVSEISDACVGAFSESQNRAKLMEQFLVVFDRLKGGGIEGDIWLDGSFVTTALDPRDVDFVLWIHCDQYDNGSDEVRAMLDALVDPLPEWPPMDCDTNVMYRESDQIQSNIKDIERYWIERMGTRPTKGPPKGIVIVRLEQVKADKEDEDEHPHDSEANS